jgi:hypothetical protein
VPDIVTPDGATLIRDEARLAGFVTFEDETLEIVPPVGASMVANLSGTGQVRLRLIATGASPVVQGRTLQVTAVAFDERNNTKYAYVGYSMRGAEALGGVDIYQISNPSRPQLRSRVTFTGTKVQALTVADGRLYLATATSDAGFEERAVLDVITLDNQGLIPANFSRTRLPLPSFIATAVHVQGNYVFVTSGSGGPNVGGLTVFRKDNLQRVGTVPMEDARWVSGGQLLVTVMQGTPGRIRLFSALGDPTAQIGPTLDVGGATIPESRGEVAISGVFGFVAAGNGGTKVTALSSIFGAATRGLGLPIPSIAGVPPELSTTNGITVWRSGLSAWLFTANGEAGVNVYTSDHLRLAFEGTPQLGAVGHINFGTSLSANMVAVEEDGRTMFVANGLGGLRIVDLD